jgi:hypothetical protein
MSRSHALIDARGFGSRSLVVVVARSSLPPSSGHARAGALSVELLEVRVDDVHVGAAMKALADPEARLRARTPKPAALDVELRGVVPWSCSAVPSKIVGM